MAEEKRIALSPVQEAPLTSSPLGIRRLEMMMILSSLSNVTTSATQLGAQEWLMYLDGRRVSVSGAWPHPAGGHWRHSGLPCSPGRASSQRSVNYVFIVYPEHVDASVLDRQKLL